MMPRLAAPALFALVLSACGDKGGKDTDATTSSSTAATTGSALTSTAGTSSTTGADLCPEGTCILFAGGACEKPTGPLGNGCCSCGPDDMCDGFCRCAAPDTPIATPTGERPIAELRPGDLVYSVDRGQRVAVPVLTTSKLPAPDHQVMRTELASGVVLSLSPGHPTADGRSFADLRPGGVLDGVPVRDARIVPYSHAFTHDILPASDTGIYFAGGVAIGSTLFTAPPRPNR